MLIVLYLIFINIAIFSLMYVDKKRAIRKQFRISEQTLLTLACLGGTFGMLAAMKIVHHKNRKFKDMIPILVIENIILILFLDKFLS
ncbi:DUF1294 domain-containing protein [Intestinibacter sp.]|uniref:DUF1294 domain-containing protein n=1 Tax=Intestinibacter sp. TaxID=1965304 RepID=UPI002A75F835|nr:DUF1294 domain-containing protein [Intestinibacter sp.]MDY2736182.1 DUF1294 domain-containing protein [Intestinibacter sp.]